MHSEKLLRMRGVGRQKLSSDEPRNQEHKMISFLEATKKIGLPIGTAQPGTSAMPEMSAVNPELNNIDPAKADATSKVVVNQPMKPRVVKESYGTLAIANKSTSRPGEKEFNPPTADPFARQAVEDIKALVRMAPREAGAVQLSARRIVSDVIATAYKKGWYDSEQQAPVSQTEADAHAAVLDGVGEMIAANLRKHPRIGKGAEIKVVETAAGKKAKVVVDARPKGGSGMWDIEETSPGEEKFVVTFKRMRKGSDEPIFSASETAYGTNAVIKAIMKWAQSTKKK
jgi:hypothetical protein